MAHHGWHRMAHPSEAASPRLAYTPIQIPVPTVYRSALPRLFHLLLARQSANLLRLIRSTVIYLSVALFQLVAGTAWHQLVAGTAWHKRCSPHRMAHHGWHRMAGTAWLAPHGTPHRIAHPCRNRTFRFDVSVGVEVVAGKYFYHLPHYRLQDSFGSSGWTPSRSTLQNIEERVEFTLRPLADWLRGYLQTAIRSRLLCVAIDRKQCVC